MRIGLTIIFVIALTISLSAQQMRIGIFNDKMQKASVFTVVKGSYLITSNDRAIMTLKPLQNVYLAREGDSVRCMVANQDLGLLPSVRFSAMNDSCIFSLHPVIPSVSQRFFDDNLEVKIMWRRLQTVNIVDIDKYLAGVVEAEGGYNSGLEYYKTQAVLCRTYVMSHVDKHVEEGFHLCDGTHCQAFKGRSNGTTAILTAAFETRGLVVIDKDTNLITAAFYSNCGGETEKSQNVWLIKRDYLVPVTDPYCQNQRNYRWEKKIPLNQWKDYLQKTGFEFKEDISPAQFNFTQYSRKQYYRIGNDSVTFRRIRSDLNIKSAFFSVEAKGENIVLHGRGYGHGVGLCQEGAMQMAKLGYNYKDIVSFYYKDVKIANYRQLPKEKNPAAKVFEGFY